MDSTLFLGLFAAVFASSGFWQFLQTRIQRKQPLEKAVLAILHDRLMHLLVCYLEAGEIETDELENLTKLYEAYITLGGNGTIKHLHDRFKATVKVKS